MIKLVICPICSFETTYEEWYDGDTPDCLNCGYPLHPNLNPLNPLPQKPSFFNRVLSLFSTSVPPIYTYKFADVSVYNGTETSINFDLFFSKVNGVIARSSAGANYYDPMYEVWKREANKRKAPFGSYHFFKADKNLDAQAGLIENSVASGEVNITPALDVETNPFVSQAGYKQMMADAVYKQLKRSEELIKRTQMIYTSPGFWNANVARNDYAKHRQLWVAHWTTALEPTLPNDWSAITNPVKETFWQKKLEDATPYGLPSDKVDINYFRGTKDQFFDLFKIYPYENILVPPPTNSWPIPTQPIKLMVISDTLFVRSGPGKSFPVIQTLKKGEVVYAHSVDAPNEAWIEIDAGKWSALKYGSVKFLEEQ